MKSNSFEESKRVSTCRGFLGYRNVPVIEIGVYPPFKPKKAVETYGKKKKL